MSPTATWVPQDDQTKDTDSTLATFANGAANRNRDLNPMHRATATFIGPSNDAGVGIETYKATPDSFEQMPIAIVGMACRLSGDVSTPDEFWELCSRARSGWSEIPAERFDNASFHHPNPGKSGCHNPIGGHFLKEDVGLFDAQFFNITAQEAISLDPQQRILLECTFEALENGGIPKNSIFGEKVGVFIGGSFSEYDLNNFRDSDTVPMYQATGCAFSLQANRISHFFNLRGPSLALDTACSSSLSALHIACQSLRNGESSQALVGGCHLNMLPEYWISMSMSRLFSNEGKSYSFDSRGTGYGRGEGCGMIILKPLNEAIKANDTIRAVIRGTGMNQDGWTPGITMPSGSAQETLMRSVYRNAGIDPADTGFVEAHGTGTKVGDPIEAAALNAVFGKGRTVRDPLYIGSVKSNIGHLEGASGIISVIKAAMMLEKGFILPNINFKTPNEQIPFTDWNLKVPTTQRPWPRGKQFASVNNFGFGGTNAHVVLERGPLPKKALAKDVYEVADIGWASHHGRKLYVLSANDKNALEAKMKSLGVYLEQRPEIFQNALMGNLAYTLGQRRSLLSWRVAIPAMSSFELITTLSSATLLPVREMEAPRIGFVFTGQGAQWHAMGRELFTQFPVFAETMRLADKCLERLGCPFSLIDELSKEADSSAIGEAHISQPSCTAIQLALTDLLGSWSVHPTAVAGHSSGEIAAAYAAGRLTLESAMIISYYRGCAIAGLKDKYPNLKGAMMAVGTSPEEILPLLTGLRSGEVKIACINSPSSITVSGDELAISELQDLVEAKQIFNRKLRVDVAYHSHHMNLVAKAYRSSIEGVKPLETSEISFHSSLVGNCVPSVGLQPAYWVENLTCSVRFSDALKNMCGPVAGLETRINMIIELGPHSALEGPVKQTLKSMGGRAAKISYAPTLVRNKDASEVMLQLAASLFTKGIALNFASINFPRPTGKPPVLLTDMPRYPWNHSTRYWHDSRMSEKHKFRKAPRNDILGTLADYSNDLEPTWRNIIRTDDLPWLRHHQFQSLSVFPMAGYIAMALEAASQIARSRGVTFDKFELREVTVSRPLVISDADIETTINLRSFQEGTRTSCDIWNEFRICSWAKESGWSEHCKGLIAVKNSQDLNVIDGHRQLQDLRIQTRERTEWIQNVCTSSVDKQRMYESLSAVGATYGPYFQGIDKCRACNSSSEADITVPDTASGMPMGYQSELIVHPAFLDQLIQMYWPVLGAGLGPFSLYMPSFIRKMSISRRVTDLTRNPGDKLRAYCYGRQPPGQPRATKMAMFATAPGDDEDPVISLDELTILPLVDGGVKSRPYDYRQLCYKLQWEPVLGSPNRLQLGMSNMNVAIIHELNGKLHPLISSLASALEHSTGMRPEVGTMSSINPRGKICIFLVELDRPFLANLTMEEFAYLQQMLTTVRGVLWVVRGAYKDSESPESNLVTGLSRTIRSETLLKFATLDLDASVRLSEALTVTTILDIFTATFGSTSTVDGELEFMERAGRLYTPLIVDDTEMNKFVHQETEVSAPESLPFAQKDRPLKIAISSPGTLDTLHFTDDSAVGTPLAEDEIEIEIKATSMNFKDVMIAMGQLPSDHLGIECSGIVSSVGSNVIEFLVGDRVCAMSKGAYSTYTRCKATSAFEIPDGMSFNEASTIPVVYCTAYYSLIDLGHACKEDTVLIHAAAGGVGQAAILLSKMIGAEIFATVGSVEKKEFIMKEYGIPEDHIFYSRNTSFASAIKRATNNRGVDVVINSLAGDSLRETWGCLAHFGRFIEIGKRDITGNSRLEMARFEHNATFASVDLTVIAAERPQLMKRLLSDVFTLLGSSTIRPISPIAIFPISDVEKAFRYLQSGKVHGKIVVVASPNDQVMAVPSKTSNNILREDVSYIIIGGTGGLGRSMTRWMAEKGAKNVVLVSRSGGAGEKVSSLVDELSSIGAKILVRRCDVADNHDVERLINSMSHMPPIGGVIHAAMVLHDVLFEKMTFDEYRSVINPKVAGAWNFHHALLGTRLDFFITISSAAGAVGNRGQAAYAAANTFLNAFVQHRIHLGLPASTIDLTAVSDVGYLAENLDKKAAVAENLGSETISESEVLALLAAAITGRMAATCNSHCITGMRITANRPPFWSTDAKFKYLLAAAAASASSATSSSQSAAIPLSAALKGSHTPEMGREIICTALINKVSAVLMLDKEEMDPKKSISSYGLDSLVAIEIRNFITREFEASLQVLELLTSSSVVALAKTIYEKSKLVVRDVDVVEGSVTELKV